MKKYALSAQHILFSILLLLVPLSSFAQFVLKKGYYISKSDSSRVDGYFDFTIKAFNIVSYYATANQNTPTELYPADVWAIAGDDGTLVLPVSIKNKEGIIELFANRILDSEVSLFESRLNENEYLYFVRSAARPELLKINKNAPDPFLKTYLAGNCVPKNKIRYTKYHLVRALKEYSKCLGNDVIQPKKNRFKLNFALGARAGLAYSQPKVSGFYVGIFDQTNGPTLGADIQMALSRRFYVRIGFNYVHTTLLKPSGDVVPYIFRGWPFTFSEPFQISYNTYEMPLELVWMLNKTKKFSPFAGAGLSFFRTSSPKYEKQFTEPDNFNHGFYSFTAEDVVNSFKGGLRSADKFNIAGQLKAGLILRFKNASFLEMGVRAKAQEVDFTFDNPFAAFPVTVKNQKWFDFSLAYYIPLTKNRTPTK